MSSTQRDHALMIRRRKLQAPVVNVEVFIAQMVAPARDALSMGEQL
jgi:hypothetical protein